MIKIDKKTIALWSAVGIFILLSLIEAALCFPLLSAIARMKEGKTAYSQEIVFARDLLSAKRGMGVVAQLTPGKEVSRMVDSLKKAGQKNNVEFLVFRPLHGVKEQDAPFNRAFFDAEVSGSFRDVGQFLSAARNMPEGIFNVEAMRVWSDAAGSDRVKAKITFALFVAKNNG
ncbi:MAG: type 4a pilus biogenesis protein PilO [Candidatus Omnitrophica bacterium]|nr:type 4a pilus biogenesis protein PilO [Candidatus Omnitrophota bacterium]